MPIPPSNNLIAHWKLNDNAANNVVFDSSKNALHGVWQHGNTEDNSVTGKIDRALSFDGINDFIAIDNHPKFNSPIFSLSVWLNHSTAPGTWDRILSKKDTYMDGNGYEITLDNGNGNILYTSGSGPVFATTQLPFFFSSGGWHHLVVVYNDTIVKVYADGVLCSTTGTILPVSSNELTLRIGKVLAEETTMWHGLMDDVRLYDMELTYFHAQSLYNRGFGTESHDSNQRPFPAFRINQESEEYV